MTRIIAFASLALLACADSTGDPREEAPPPEPDVPDAAVPDEPDPPRPDLVPGGYVKVERFVDGAAERVWAIGEIYDGHTGPGRLPAGFYRDFPVDHCFAIPRLPDEPSFYDYLDVGDSLELRRGGGESITLTRQALLDTIFYRVDNLSASVTGVEYAIEIDGTAAGLRVPAEPQVTLSIGAELSAAWQPTGADRVLLIFQQGDVGRVCRLADDGAFTLPAEHARAVPAFGTVVFMALDLDRAVHQGREIELVGVHGVTAEYER